MGLSITNLSHAYHGVPILQDVSIDIPKGKIVCLLGPSGCGKSTLLRLVAGLEPIQMGKVCFSKSCVTHLPPHERQLGLVFQHPSLFPHLTVSENMRFGMKDLSETKLQEQEEYWLELIGLRGIRESYPHMLSGGQQQRVALARTLASKPKALLLDEPFANLDIVLRRQMRSDTLEILRKTDIPILMITHDPEEATQMADSIYVMHHGEIIQQGTADALYAAPKNAFVAHLFGGLNSFDATITKTGLDTVFGKIKRKKPPQGEKTTIYLRPEDIKVSTKATKKSLPAIVDACYFSIPASSLSLHLKQLGVKVQVYWQGDDLPKVGDTLHVTIDKNHILLFEAS